MLLARYLLKPRRLLILDEPTRGVDVGARAEIYALMNRLTAEGLAMLMISSDLPEVLGMSDRIVVMREGRTARRARARGGHRRSASWRWRRDERHDGALDLRYAIFVALGARVRVPRLRRPTRSSRPANLANVLRQNAFTAILAAGMTFVILTGGHRPVGGIRRGAVGRALRRRAAPGGGLAGGLAAASLVGAGRRGLSTAWSSRRCACPPSS